MLCRIIAELIHTESVVNIQHLQKITIRIYFLNPIKPNVGKTELHRIEMSTEPSQKSPKENMNKSLKTDSLSKAAAPYIVHSKRETLKPLVDALM